MTTILPCTRKDLTIAATHILAFFRTRNITSFSDLQHIAKQGVRVAHRTDALTFETRPSWQGTQSHDINYSRDTRGIPLSICVNPLLQYTLFFLKVDFTLDFYEHFVRDPIGNMHQYRQFQTISIPVVTNELERLAASQSA